MTHLNCDRHLNFYFNEDPRACLDMCNALGIRFRPKTKVRSREQVIHLRSAIEYGIFVLVVLYLADGRGAGRLRGVLDSVNEGRT